MNLSPKPSGRKLKSKTLWLLAALGFVLFAIVQLIPSTESETLQLKESEKVISKQQAAAAAAKFATSVLHLSVNPENDLVTYETQSDLYGYLTKEGLMAQFLKNYEKKFPYDVFRVRFTNPDQALTALTVDVHMTTGKVVGFEKIAALSSKNKQLLQDFAPGNTESLRSEEGDLTLLEKERLAAPYLAVFDFKQTQIKRISREGDIGLQYRVSQYKVGQSEALIDFGYDYGAVSSMKAHFSVPKSHTDYITRQTNLAKGLTVGGYVLLSFILGILAIVYSGLTRNYTSFKRGIFLAAAYYVITIVTLVNTLPALQNESFSQELVQFEVIFQAIISLFMAALVYFSLVGGDGLWRREGLNLWARAKEPGYGRHVLSSVADAYAWALILLGVQSVIFFILEKTVHTWSTTDSTQSPYNLIYPVLVPLSAWFAGIGEEAVYRLFGIPMLKKMFRSTFAASVITTLIWALGHTLYPIFPVYSRPIELLFIGLLFSFIFLRYGFVTVLFTHTIFDSILMSLSIMFLGGGLNFAAGLFYIALPAIVAYIIYRFNPPGKERHPLPPQTKEEPLFTAPAVPHPEGRL